MEVNYKSLISKNCKNIPTSFVREILAVCEQPDMISFAGGLPNPTCFPAEQMKQAFIQIMENEGAETLQYAGSQGYLPLRQWICDRYNSKYGLSISPENILITNGSQQALDLIGKLLINPGDPLMMEKPSYLGAIQAFSAYRPEFHQITLNSDGLDLNELEDTILKTESQVLYGIPNFQNPTGITYSAETRENLAILLDWHNILFVEDDPYGEIRFEGKFQAPVFALNPDHTIWCGSFSKMISPGLRTGWICVPKELMPYLLRIKQATDLHTNNVVQRIIYRFLTDNNLEDHLCKVRLAYKAQKDCMIESIRKHFPEEISYTNPEGGMFIWATLPESMNSEALIQKAIQEKVVFVPGKSFFTADEGQRNMRLNYSNSSEEMIEEGIKRLGTIIKKAHKKTSIRASMAG
ncbi:MAG: PLP-dependent aminotransferase family protein [Prolixibacteraceae bacterium]|nr:PLP-dependent aminotransferase family protein [Prolixibacteraceae bacterium]